MNENRKAAKATKQAHDVQELQDTGREYSPVFCLCRDSQKKSKANPAMAQSRGQVFNLRPSYNRSKSLQQSSVRNLQKMQI
jgi:hypothetical protein